MDNTLSTDNGKEPKHIQFSRADGKRKTGNAQFLSPSARPEILAQAVQDLAIDFEAGKLSHSDLSATCKSWVGKLKKDFNYATSAAELQKDIEEAIAALKAQAEPEKNVAVETPRLSKKQLQIAHSIGEKDLVTVVREGLHNLGYVANRKIAQALAHIIWSRLAHRKMGWLLNGASRSGKSALLECGFQFVHPSNRMRATSMTTGALFSLGELKNVFILAGELKTSRPGEDDPMQQFLRQFLSEPVISHFRLEKRNTKDGEQYERKEVSVSGFASVAYTSVKDTHALKDEFALRLTAVSSDESPKTTSKAQELMAERRRHPVKSSEREKKTIEELNWFDLSLEPMVVKIPFADQIMLNSDCTTARGIFDLLLLHIEISALINQHKSDRRRTKDGCIVATIDDYEAAYGLVNEGAFRVRDSVSSRARQSFERLRTTWRDHDDNPRRRFTLQELVDFLRAPRSTVQGWLCQWVEANMVTEDLLTRPRIYRMTKYVPRAAQLGLVTPKELREKLESERSVGNSAKSLK